MNDLTDKVEKADWKELAPFVGMYLSDKTSNNGGRCFIRNDSARAAYNVLIASVTAVGFSIYMAKYLQLFLD